MVLVSFFWVLDESLQLLVDHIIDLWLLLGQVDEDSDEVEQSSDGNN